MARKLPHIHFVEIDLPGVVDEKLSRLQAANITIPPNIEWQRADLGVTTLAQVLDQRQVTVTTAEGLMPYFTFTDIERIAHYACESLASGGLFVCDVGWGQSLRDQPDDSVAFINRQAGSFLGLFESIDHIRDMFSSAGYAEVTVLYPSKFIPMPEVLQPVIDGELIVAARKA